MNELSHTQDVELVTGTLRFPLPTVPQLILYKEQSWSVPTSTLHPVWSVSSSAGPAAAEEECWTDYFLYKAAAGFPDGRSLDLTRSNSEVCHC